MYFHQETLFRIVLAASFASAIGATSTKNIANVLSNPVVADRIFFHEKKQQRQHNDDQHQHRDLASSSSVGYFQGGAETMKSCDSTFINCVSTEKCMECFGAIQTNEIDWTGIPSKTDCSQVVKYLKDAGHCKTLDGDDTATEVFCNTFTACAVWTNDDDDDSVSTDDDEDAKKPDGWVNCTALTECEWEGMHKNWVGDGVCHDNIEGCYNTKICDYDGGDCCEDTCEITEKSSYVECGHDGYACKNPSSEKCDGTLTTKCPPADSSEGNKKKGGGDGKEQPDPSTVKCGEDETKYRLVMYDSFGDGWDATTLTISPDNGSKKSKDSVFKGGLVDGFQGTEYICLSKSPTCYNAVAEGGKWGVEVSWEIRPMAEGSPSIAGGASPSDCDFSVAGEVCSKTCDGTKPDVDPTKDPDYKSFKDLQGCLEEKCVLQMSICENNEACEKCFVEDAPDFCYGIEDFVSLVDCAMCTCSEKKGTDFCTKKLGPGIQVIPATPPSDEENSGPKKCTPEETKAGTQAIMDYSECANMETISVLVSEFDQNNFGQLDTFETCAHSYRDEDNHGGRTALSCMQILKNAKTNPTVEDNKDAPVEAIKALASDLYDRGESFCDCSKKASDTAPLCSGVHNFKTILYESIDACQSLDAIDCDSWNEFWKPCQTNLEKQFGSSELADKDQCDYVKDDCGGAGPFPAFRRLDCEKELPTEAWDFYKKFSKKCLKGEDGIAPTEAPSVKPPGADPTNKPTSDSNPKPTPSAPTPSSDNNPTPKPYSPSDDNKPTGDKPTPKPYIPSDGATKEYIPSSVNEDKNKSNWFRHLLFVSFLGGVVYYAYNKRYEISQYGRRFLSRHRYYGGGGMDYGMVNTTRESEMYGNLNTSTTFEPPSLPPNPQQMI